MPELLLTLLAEAFGAALAALAMQLIHKMTESVKPGETRGVYALCVASWRGSLIQAMVGSLGGWGRRVNRVGLAA